MENQANNTNPQQPIPQQQAYPDQPQVQPIQQPVLQADTVQQAPIQPNIAPMPTPAPPQNAAAPAFQDQFNNAQQPVQANIPPTQTFGTPVLSPAAMPAGGATPSLGNAYFDKPKPGITLGVLSLIFAVLMPIVGFVLAIISIIKGFKKPNNNTALAIMGIAAIPVCIIATFVWLLAAGSLTTTKYDKLVTYSGSYGSIGYSFDYPEEMVEDTSTDAPNVAFLKDPIGDDEGTNNSVAIFIAEDMGSINLTPDMVEEVYKGSQGKTVMESVLKTSVSDIDDGKNLTLGDYTSASSGGLEGFYMDVSYNSTRDDLLIKGRIAFFVDTQKNAGYTLIMLAPEKVWNANTVTWDKMQKSIEGVN